MSRVVKYMLIGAVLGFSAITMIAALFWLMMPSLGWNQDLIGFMQVCGIVLGAIFIVPFSVDLYQRRCP